MAEVGLTWGHRGCHGGAQVDTGIGLGLVSVQGPAVKVSWLWCSLVSRGPGRRCSPSTSERAGLEAGGGGVVPAQHSSAGAQASL